MHIVKFCEYRYQELALKSQSEKEYDCATDAETKAVHFVLNSYRTALKWLMVPKSLLDYALVQLGEKPEPRPAFLDKLAAQKKEEDDKAQYQDYEDDE